MDKEVDEVEIEGERTEQCQFLGIGVGILETHAHLLDLLGVVSGETHENQHAKITHYRGHHAVVEEQVHQRGDNDADKAHEQVFAKRGKVGLRGVAN